MFGSGSFWFLAKFRFSVLGSGSVLGSKVRPSRLKIIFVILQTFLVENVKNGKFNILWHRVGDIAQKWPKMEPNQKSGLFSVVGSGSQFLKESQIGSRSPGTVHL